MTSKEIRAAAPGRLVEGGGLPNRELLTIDHRLSGMLLQCDLDDPIRVLGWPTVPGKREAVLLARHEIYARDAKVFRVSGGKPVEVPRSRLLFFWGSVEGDEDTRVLAWLDPETEAVEGLSRSPSGIFELRRTSGPRDERLLAPAEALLEAGVRPTWSCGEEALTPEVPETSGHATAAPEAQAAAALAAITTLHTATVAIDTDNEFMLQKFSDNTTNATNYIASLFATIDVMYERDLLVRLVQGTTFLRVSTTADPYSVSSGGNANSAELNEFTSYWSSNYGGVSRALAAMLSGKQPSSSSASGIAWVNTLCSTGVGYSFSQVFKVSYLSGDAMVVGHEIGHNFGSQHTHCYIPEERCWNQEACYTGPVACPPSGVGSVMSYCHLLSGCSAGPFFHPATISLLAPLIGNAAGVCIFPLAVPAPSISGVTPSFGPVAGGTLATITGANFQSGATVAFGGTAATNVTFVGSTSLTALTPAHAAGVVNVVVTNPDAQSGTLVNGYDFQDGSGFHTLAPCRVLDTRNTTGPLGGPALTAGSDRTFSVVGRCGIPSGAKAISVNATVTLPSVAGDVRIYAAGSSLPVPTAIVYRSGQTRANNAVIALSPGGAFTVHCDQTTGTVQFLVDVNGYFQ